MLLSYAEQGQQLQLAEARYKCLLRALATSRSACVCCDPCFIAAVGQGLQRHKLLPAFLMATVITHKVDDLIEMLMLNVQTA